MAGEKPAETPAEKPAEQQDEQKTVPIEALEAEKQKTAQAEQTTQVLQEQLRIQQANPPQVQPQQQQDIFDGIFDEDDEIVDPKQFKEGLNRVMRVFSNVASSLQATGQHSDHSDIVGKYLPEVINKDPALAQELANLQKTNPAAAISFGYRLAKTNPQYQKDQDTAVGKGKEETPEQKAAAEAIKAAKRPGSASQAAGGGALNLANQIANETDDQFEARVEKVKAQG